ncbi:MAG: PAS domain S-box protein [Gemmatimonadetes bacterium]|nr:PAS domain S-box protein [Gemmatimonadota bacterium]
MLLLLVVTVVRLELEQGWNLQRGSIALFLGAVVVGIGGTGFAFNALQRLRRATSELQRSERTFQGILLIAADAIISVDEEQRIVHYNHGAEAMFGYPADVMLGQPLERLLPDRHRVAHARHVQSFGSGADVARRMGERRQIFGLKRDGTEFPAEASISKLEVDGVRLYNVVLRDITTRLRAEESARFLARAGNDLNATLDYEETLIAACHAAVPYLCDCAVIDILEGSGEVRRLTSVHDDPGRTRVLRALAGRLPAATDWPFPVASVLAGATGGVRRGVPEAPAGVDPAIRAAVDALGVVATITMPLRARGRVYGAISLVSTDRHRVCGDDEVALAHSMADQVSGAIDNAALYRDERRASQMRDELLGIVSHDLRNPLSAISMCARVLAEHEPATPTARAEVAGAILESVAAMQRLIQDLLDAATIESGHLRITTEVVSIDSVIRGVRTMMSEPAAERGIALTFDTAAGLPTVELDALRMEQVLANLVGNAIKFTERDGRVTVRSSVAPGGLRIEVEDTGMGIPTESLPHIFDRFWHARRASRTAGTGLGLAIARGIVLAHGGTLSVRSEVGVGSTFSIFLPASSSGQTQGQTNTETV